MKHCCIYTQALSVTHARISLRNHERSIRKESGKLDKNGRLPCGRKYGNAIATKPLYEKRQINSGATRILSPSLSLSCVSRR